jgi:hypothetical protein
MYQNQNPIQQPIPERVGGTAKDGGYAFSKPVVGENVVRIPKIIYQDSGTSTETVSPGNTHFKIRLPSNGTYCFKFSKLLFDVRLTGTGGTTIALVNGAWNVLNRFRHLQSGNCIEERQDWNEGVNLKMLARSDPTVFGKMREDYGVGTLAERQAWGLTTRTYAVPVDVGFLNSGNLAFGEVGNSSGGPAAKGLAGAHDLEFYLNLPSNCMESDKTDLKIYISNIRWLVEKLEGSEYERKLAQWLTRGDVAIPFKMVDKFQAPVFQISQTLNIGHRARYLDSIIGHFANLNDLQDPTSATLNRHWYWPKLDLLNYQFRDSPLPGSNAVYPSETVDCQGNSERAYHFYQKWVDAWISSGLAQDAASISKTNFNSTRFLIVGDFRSNRSGDERVNNIINLQSSDTTYNDIKLHVQFSTTPSAGDVMNFFIFYTVLHNVTKTGFVEYQITDYRMAV